jgi:hypothetical protein
VAAALPKEPDRALESLVEPLNQRKNRRRFGFEDLSSERQVTH